MSKPFYDTAILDDGDRLVVALDSLDVEHYRTKFEAHGPTRPRVTILAPHPETNELFRWDFPLTVLNKLNEAKRRGWQYAAITREGEKLDTAYRVFPVRTREQTIVQELIDLADQIEEEDAPL